MIKSLTVIKPCAYECIEDMDLKSKLLLSNGFNAFLKSALESANQESGIPVDAGLHGGVSCTVLRDDRNGYYEIDFTRDGKRDSLRFLLPVCFGENLWTMEQDASSTESVCVAGACTHSIDQMRSELSKRYPNFLEELGGLGVKAEPIENGRQRSL